MRCAPWWRLTQEHPQRKPRARVVLLRRQVQAAAEAFLRLAA